LKASTAARKQAESWANCNICPTNYKGLSHETCNITNNIIYNMRRRYGIPGPSSIVTSTLKGETIARITRVDNILRLNNRILVSRDVFDEHIKAFSDILTSVGINIAFNKSDTGLTIEQVIAHEMGHFLLYKLLDISRDNQNTPEELIAYGLIVTAKEIAGSNDLLNYGESIYCQVKRDYDIAIGEIIAESVMFHYLDMRALLSEDMLDILDLLADRAQAEEEHG
jgi:hypothetical protein